MPENQGIQSDNKTKTWIFNRDGVDEAVKLEKYCWKVIYADGSILKQFDDRGVFHQFKEIDQSKDFIFQMLEDNDDDKVKGGLIIKSHQKLIHYYKRYGLDFMGQHKKVVLYVYGYETKNGKVLNVITPRGEIVTTDDIANLNVG